MSAEPDFFSDRIHIHQLELAARVGVPEKERAAPQRLTASITLWPRQQPEELDDDIAKTVNYSKVCEETKKFVLARSDKLIETLADRLDESDAPEPLAQREDVPALTAEDAGAHSFTGDGITFTGHRLDQSGFAAAVRAEDGDVFAARDAQRDIVQDDFLAASHRSVLQFNESAAICSHNEITEVSRNCGACHMRFENSLRAGTGADEDHSRGMGDGLQFFAHDSRGKRGGGCGEPPARDGAALDRDIAEGYISADAAKKEYGR